MRLLLAKPVSSTPQIFYKFSILNYSHIKNQFNNKFKILFSNRMHKHYLSNVITTYFASRHRLYQEKLQIRR